jgi:hypothetical protein
MITPFLAHTPRFAQYTSDGTNSAQSAMDAIRIALLGAGWTEPGAAYTLYSPARADGIQLRLTLAMGSSATQITYVVRDHVGRLVNNETLTRQNIPTGQTCNVYCSDTYVYHEINNSTSVWGCAVLHREPDPIAEPVPVYWATFGPLRNDGTNTAQFLVYNNWISAGGAGGPQDMLTWRGHTNTTDHFSAQGSMMFYPMECVSASWMYGRLPNVLLLDASQWAGNTFELPLDETTVATFRVIRGGSMNNFVAAVRIS